MKQWVTYSAAILTVILGSACATGAGAHSLLPPPDQAARTTTCEGFGPQTPRNIDDPRGTNPGLFSSAPDYTQMNLCNIHFHESAEHRAAAFSIPAADGGFLCAMSQNLTAAEARPPAADICGGLQPGDTIEVHWVYSSCNVVPGEGLGACLNDSCANPDLRVEAQVFTLVNDSEAMDFTSFRYRGTATGPYHQAVALPTGTGEPVQFPGSTTGPAYSSEVCSPLQVWWSVRPECAKLDIKSLGAWCRENPFGEDHAHGVRPLVTDPALLAPIR